MVPPRDAAPRPRSTQLYDARFFRMWQFYLAGAEQGFRHGNWSTSSSRRQARSAVPMTRDYIEAEAARLSAAEQAPEWHLAEAAE